VSSKRQQEPGLAGPTPDLVMKSYSSYRNIPVAMVSRRLAATGTLVQGLRCAHERRLRTGTGGAGAVSCVVWSCSHWSWVFRVGDIAPLGEGCSDHADVVLRKRGHSVVDAAGNPADSSNRSFLDSPWKRPRDLRPHFREMRRLPVEGVPAELRPPVALALAKAVESIPCADALPGGCWSEPNWDGCLTSRSFRPTN
jgi:hypothetical protein